jgi:hypothetical protein
MGQHKSYEKERSWLHLLLCFVAGTLLVAACLYYYHFYSRGIIEAKGIGKLLGFGLLLMAAPIWAYVRKRKRRPRNPAG